MTGKSLLQKPLQIMTLNFYINWKNFCKLRPSGRNNKEKLFMEWTPEAK